MNNKKILDFLLHVTKVYMPCSAYELELMTHNEKPWIEARGGCEADEKCNNKIDVNSMTHFYGEKIKD